jgi:hypothetical protein
MQFIDNVSEWIIIVPTEKLIVSDDSPINGQWNVCDITFASKLGLANFIRQSNLPSGADILSSNMYNEHVAFAYTKREGTISSIRNTIFRDIVEAANIIASTNAIRSRDCSMTGFSLYGSPLTKSRHEYYYDITSRVNVSHMHQHGMMLPFKLDDEWHRCITVLGYNSLFARIVDPTIEANWRRQIKSAAAMLGKSMLVLERADAFLLNVMGLETLLTVRNERNGNKLCSRIDGILGWYLEKNRPGYREEIASIYQVRNEIIHDSDYTKLTTELLVRSDAYLLNCLFNITSHPQLFPDKLSLMKVADNYSRNRNWPKDDSIEFQWTRLAEYAGDNRTFELW